MLISLDSGVSALDQFQENLDVIGNNIANVDTVGYKSADMQFADAFSQSLGDSDLGPMQVGTGVMMAGISSEFTQGSISSTGVPTDMAINGNGFYLVKDPVSGAEYATRDGEFSVDSNGYLVTSSGMRVQGETASGALGDIQISNAGAPAGDTSAVQNYSFSSNGTLTIELADGTSFTGGQVMLQNFNNPNQLTKMGDDLYSNLTAAGPLATPAAPGSGGVGSLVTGSLEMSNVDLAAQLTDLITTQRAYEANTKVITTSDDILQDLVNLPTLVHRRLALSPLVTNLRESPGSINRCNAPHVFVSVARRIGKPSGHDALLSGIVSSDHEAQVTVKEPHQPVKIGHSSADVLFNHETVA